MPMLPKPRRMPPIDAPIVPPTDDIVTARRRKWAGWLDECAFMQDAFVEGMLANIPNDGPDD